MAERVQMTVVQVRMDDRWRAVAVIDGRDYPDRQAYDRAVTEAFEQCNGSGLPAQFSSRDVFPDEVPYPLPSWVDYLAGRTEERARELLAEYHNEDLPPNFPRHTADAFRAFQVTPYEEWLIFTTDGFSNQTFLVSDPVVYVSPGWQSYEDALTAARALKKKRG